MDPVSVAASTIAFLQAAAAIGKGVRALRALGNLPAEVHGLSNELTSLQALVSQLQHNLAAQQHGQLQQNTTATNEIERLRAELSLTIADLESLVKRFDTTRQKSSKTLQRRRLQVRWIREKEHVNQLRSRARDTRDALTVFLASVASSESIKNNKLILQIERVSQISSGTMKQCVDENIALSKNLNTSLLRIEDKLLTMQKQQEESFETIQFLKTAHQQRDPSRPTESDKQNFNFNEGSILCLQTFIRPRCVATCKCQCHKSSSITSPSYFQNILGAFFVSYNVIPIFGTLSCDFAGCTAKTSQNFRFHYQLPSWFMSRAISISMSWSSMAGSGATLHLKIPRVIEGTDPIWNLIKLGSIDRIRQRLTEGKNSPTDMSKSGSSLFLFAMRTSNDRCNVLEALFQAGCDPSIKTSGRICPAYEARTRILYSDVMPIDERLLHLYKRVVELDEESECLNSSVIHDSILGLRKISLEDAIALEPQSINSLDGMGHAPMHWAVKRRNMDAISTLLTFKCDINVTDPDHGTPLHHSAGRGLVDITRLLLEAGCNSNLRNKKGLTALHVACYARSINSAAIAKELLKHGCLPNIREIQNNSTALNYLLRQCRFKDPEDCEDIIDTLLRAGADINETDKAGCTPILWVSQIRSSNKLFRLLYNRGARIDVLESKNRSVLHYAASHGQLDHYEYLRKLELCEPDPESIDIEGNTPLDLMQWRLRTEDQSLWPNTKRPTSDEIESFSLLIDEIKARRTTE